MDNATNNQIRMIRTTIKAMDLNPNPWDGFVKMESYVGQVKGIVLDIDAKFDLLMEIDGGPKKRKELVRNLLIQSTLKISGSGYAYADDEDETLLMEKMDITKSDITALVDSEQANKAEMVLNVVTPLVSSLGDYNVLLADLTDLHDLIVEYRDFLTAPKNSNDAGSGLRDDILLLVKKALWILKKMDRLMEHLKEDHSEFVKVYFKARMIIDLGHRYRKPISFVSGKTKKLGTGETLVGVKLTILGDEKHGVVSSAIGEYSIGAYQEGDMILVAEKVGFGRKEFPLVIVKGENQDLDIDLEAVAPNPPDPNE